MYQPIQFKTTTSSIGNSINRSSTQRACLLLPLVLVCFALLPTTRAVSPPPGGGYAGGNTAAGNGALFHLTSGTNNTAIGFEVLENDTIGNYSTATGSGALLFNTSGNDNTANGFQALASNTTGSNNTAIGYGALFHNTTLSGNTATGYEALFYNTGTHNAATGVQSLYFNTAGIQNTANGAGALLHNTTANNNTADGFEALLNDTTGSSNIALGVLAGANLTTGSNNIDVGNGGVAAEAATIRIGTVGTQTRTFIAGIYGATASSGAAVFINASGELGTLTSSARFKEAIKPMDKASEAILALKPVTFRYKKDLDPGGIPQFGLVAEEVEKVTPNLVTRDAEGKAYTVRYEAVNAMLLNEFLKEHHKVEEQVRKMHEQEVTIAELKSVAAKQEAVNAEQQKGMEAIIAHLKQQDSKIQKVTARLEVSRPAPRTVVDNQ
jgi:hypothetical protein